MRDPDRNRALYLLLALLFPSTLLVAIVASSPDRLVYDEPYHLGFTRQIEEQGLRGGLLSSNHLSAAGPLYAWMHLAARSLTNLDAPAIRWINVMCLAGTIAALAWWLRRGTGASPLWACQLLAAPFLWPGVGMALTELPALLPFTIFGALTAILLTRKYPHAASSWAYAIAAGLALGSAILGRQTYLVVVAAVVMTALYARQYLWPLLVVAVTAVASSGWLFWIWGGLVAPHMAHSNAGLRPEHALLSLSYLGLAAAFIAPLDKLPRRWSTLAGVLLVAFALTAGLYAYFHFIGTPLKPPAAGLLRRLVGPQLADYLGFIPRWLMAAAGILWLWVTLVDLWTRRHDPAFVLLALSLFALAVTPVKVSHGFSSRYVIGALSLMVVQFARPAPPRWTEAVRGVIGAVIGAGILWSYYAHGT